VFASFLIAVTRVPDKNNLNDDKVYFAHGFRSYSPPWQGRHGKRTPMAVDRKQSTAVIGRGRGKT
jgi:hypothetical protein